MKLRTRVVAIHCQTVVIETIIHANISYLCCAPVHRYDRLKYVYDVLKFLRLGPTNHTNKRFSSINLLCSIESTSSIEILCML